MADRLSSETLIQSAMETCQSEDFGGETFKDGLEALIHSLNTDLDLLETTSDYFTGLIHQLLVNRLEVAKLIAEHPTILEEEIENPVFILGLPRTGTTMLHTLMALDPVARYLRNFESAMAVCPPPELMPGYIDPRIQMFHDAMEGFFSMMPQLRGINGLNFMANGTAECQNLTAHEFVHMGWSAGSSLFSYGEWISNCNMAAAYQYHKLLLKILQWKLPNERWVLKAPMHLFGVDHLLETYPDAKIVFVHRDPLDAMTSGVSMVYHWTQFSTMQADIPAISKWYPKLWAKGLEKALAVRQEFSESSFYDVFHQDLSTNAVQTVQQIYAHFNLHFSKAHQKRMKTWLRENPRSRFGHHPYTIQGFELNPRVERARFKFYLDQYNV